MSRRRDLGIILAVVALTITAVYRDKLLFVPLIVMAMVEAALLYVSAYLRTWVTIFVVPIGAASMGWFIFHYHNAPILWATFAVAIVFGAALVFLLAPREGRQGSDDVFTNRS